MRLSLKAKTILGTALIQGVLLLLLVFTVTKFMADIANENLGKRAETAAKLFATTSKNSVLSYDLASLDSIVSEVIDNPDVVYARVVDESGKVFAKKGDAVAIIRPFQADSNVSDVDDGVFDSTSPIIESGTLYGRVEIGISVTQVQSSIASITRLTAGIALFEMVLVALFSLFLGGYLTKQLNVLRQSAKNISKALDSGQFDVARVPEDSQAELAEVISAFNSLIDSLEGEQKRTTSFQNALQNLNRTLEAKVEKRTHQIELQNCELKQINNDLKSAQQQLMQAEKMASVGQLAAGLAHEINTPIGFIKGNVSCLKNYIDVYVEVCTRAKALSGLHSETAVFNEHQAAVINELTSYLESQDIDFINNDIKELLVDTEGGLKRVIEIVQNMRIFSRADSDSMQLIDINQCILTTAKMVKSKIEQNAQLILELKDVPLTLLNVGKINQVLTNLVMNAGQAVELNGIVAIRSEVVGSDIKIHIIDNGCGMDEVTLKNIFNPFFTTKAEGEGTGLGLSISFDIMQEHGGSIDVRSREGKGTTFTLILPITQTVENKADYVRY
ncbi:MAG: two-component system NtrC family sensor kinase [Glaciecola sp.]|jgi:two-component system NtrC family sensor kinase